MLLPSYRNLQATDQLWGIIKVQKDKASAAATAASAAVPSVGGTEDADMTDASAAAAPISAAAPAVTPAAVPAAPETATALNPADPSSGGRDREKEPRAVAEKAVLALLSVLEQLSSATNISSSPSVRDLDWACLSYLI